MVKLEVLSDEVPAGPAEKVNDDIIDSPSEDEFEDDDFDVNETFADRIVALKDIVPPQVRAKVNDTFSSAYSLAGSAASLGGSGLWILTSATLLFGIPFGLCLAAEEQLNELENNLAAGGAGADNMLAPEGQPQTPAAQ